MGIMSRKAGPATSGKIPISNPSNIQPRKAAMRTRHWPRVSLVVLAITELAVSVVFRFGLPVSLAARVETRRGINDEYRMTNEERNPKSGCRRARRGLPLISDFDHWLF